ncbi:ABC transporter permease [Candidatus Dependentiae bacterium]|nr:ABC transporter permease [Candidatus Dependentiae bacterium]
MNYLEALRQSLLNLKANKMRSFLTMIGIVVGVAAVVGIISMGQGAKESINKDLRSFGENLWAVYPDYDYELKKMAKPIYERDLVAFENINEIKLISPVYHYGVNIRRYNKNMSSSMLGIDKNYMKITNRKVSLGRDFRDSDFEYNRYICIITEKIQEDLFKSENPVNQTIKVNKINFTIIGVLKPQELESFLSNLVQKENNVLIPKRFVKRITSRNQISYVYLKTKENVNYNEFQSKIRRILKWKKGPGNKYVVSSLEQQIKVFSNVMNTVTMIISIIAGLSLFVGGIGIMNIMLISVTERTKEIGIRKAVGASRGDILRQFLIEAVVLSSIGGVSGIIFGSLFSVVIAKIAHWPVSISVPSIIIAFTFSFVVGIIFGIFPANKASRLNPIDCLHYE